MFVSCHFTNCKLAATCPLKLQLAPPGTPAVVFHKVKCKLAKPDKNCYYIPLFFISARMTQMLLLQY